MFFGFQINVMENVRPMQDTSMKDLMGGCVNVRKDIPVTDTLAPVESFIL